MTHYIKEIAKVNKLDRYNVIIKVLKDNKVEYRIQSIPEEGALGNIIVEFNSNSNDKKIVVSAHYDNYPGTPGANDNASACSILLNLILNNRNTNKHLEFVFFDLEERGCVGSTYYIEHEKNIKYAINMDMCGIGENIVFSQDYLRIVDDVVGKYGAYKVREIPTGDGTNFIRNHIPTMYVINSTENDLRWYLGYAMGRAPFMIPDFLKTMHKPNDIVENINFSQVEKITHFLDEIIKN